MLLLLFPQQYFILFSCVSLIAALAKAALKFGSAAWLLKKREEQRLEAAQMKFLRHLLGITKLDKEKNECIRQKTGAQNTVKEIKQYQKKWLQHVQRMDTNRLPKVATTCTEDGHKQTTKSGYNLYRGWTQTDYQNKHYNINQKDEGT